MAKTIKTIHTLDLNHGKSIDNFLSFLKDKDAKVRAFSRVESISSVRSVLTIYRVKEKK